MNLIDDTHWEDMQIRKEMNHVYTHAHSPERKRRTFIPHAPFFFLSPPLPPRPPSMPSIESTNHETLSGDRAARLGGGGRRCLLLLLRLRSLALLGYFVRFEGQGLEQLWVVCVVVVS
jgi:hypothetical protein